MGKEQTPFITYCQLAMEREFALVCRFDLAGSKKVCGERSTTLEDIPKWNAIPFTVAAFGNMRSQAQYSCEAPPFPIVINSLSA
ncbi:hypothetical protein AVEN_40363-1 [Araneus ventricosus]|uniref:Uncharacterized protein n=1 Tax=Araneus ventricosus TaxID=182803 RepID=A0A4Y2M3R2_ARAVE|nr:hypothetical protein AVEN_40363-1 [Araneus ventricosus]